MMTSNLIKHNWGPKPRLAKWLFTGIIRPKLSYASMAWGHAIQTKELKAKLKSLNRLAALTIAPARRSTPTAGMEVLYDLIPLDLFLEKTAIMTNERLKNILQENWKGENKTGRIVSHLSFWEKRKQQLDIDFPDDDSCKVDTEGNRYKIIICSPSPLSATLRGGRAFYNTTK